MQFELLCTYIVVLHLQVMPCNAHSRQVVLFRADIARDVDRHLIKLFFAGSGHIARSPGACIVWTVKAQKVRVVKEDGPVKMISLSSLPRHVHTVYACKPDQRWLMGRFASVSGQVMSCCDAVGVLKASGAVVQRPLRADTAVWSS